MFCSQSEEMHSELIPMPSGEEEWAGLGGMAGYSHYGEFQALLKKWTNREVSLMIFDTDFNLRTFVVGCSCVCESSTTVPL